MDLKQRIERLTSRLIARKQIEQSSDVLERIKQDPLTLCKLLSIEPDPWQRDLLVSQCSENPYKRVVLACARQTGKSTVLALFAGLRMITAGETIALSAPSFRQSLETAQRVRRILKQTNLIEITRDSLTDTVLANGGRLVVLPSAGATSRGFTIHWLLSDESAFLPVDCDLLETLAPALSLADGGIILCSSPGPTAGLLYDAWTSPNWHKIKVTAAECPRISREFLEEQRDLLGETGYRREYLAEFVSEGSLLITSEQLAACIRPSSIDDEWLGVSID